MFRGGCLFDIGGFRTRAVGWITQTIDEFKVLLVLLEASGSAGVSRFHVP